MRRSGPSGFITHVESVLASGVRKLETSRRDRKGRGPLYFTPKGHPVIHPAHTKTDPWLRFWAPDRISWWVAANFIVGSIIFCLAPLMDLFPETLRIRVLNTANLPVIYAVGTIFFTSACYCQVLEVINARRGPDFFVRGLSGQIGKFRLFAWEPGQLAFRAAFIQFLGALCFNVDCGLGLIQGQGWLALDLMQWLPGVLGSICFVWSGYLSVLEVSHSLRAVLPKELSWWVVTVNFLGCVFFLLGGVLSFASPLSQDLARMIAIPADWFNFLGALGFLISSYLMLPEMFSD